MENEVLPTTWYSAGRGETLQIKDMLASHLINTAIFIRDRYICGQEYREHHIIPDRYIVPRRSSYDYEELRTYVLQFKAMVIELSRREPTLVSSVDYRTKGRLVDLLLKFHDKKLIFDLTGIEM